MTHYNAACLLTYRTADAETCAREANKKTGCIRTVVREHVCTHARTHVRRDSFCDLHFSAMYVALGLIFAMLLLSCR